MRYRVVSGPPVGFYWRERLRHNKGWEPDDTIFTYPDIEGTSVPNYNYEAYEDAYGDGYNNCPYETDWQLFFDAYNQHIRENGTDIPVGGPSFQADRYYSYKTVSCKFKV
jgi:hypothetical protein